MPDFMSGLAKGIDRSKGIVEKAISEVADLMDLKGALPDMQASLSANLSGSGSASDGGEVVLNQPILLDGKTLTTAFPASSIRRAERPSETLARYKEVEHTCLKL